MISDEKILTTENIDYKRLLPLAISSNMKLICDLCIMMLSDKKSNEAIEAITNAIMAYEENTAGDSSWNNHKH